MADSGEIQTMHTIPRIVNIQRRVAEETGCAFFDTFKANGGRRDDGTLELVPCPVSFPRILIHPSATGGKIIAALLTEELLAGLARFKAKRGGSNTPDLVLPESTARQTPRSESPADSPVETGPISQPAPDHATLRLRCQPGKAGQGKRQPSGRRLRIYPACAAKAQ